MTLKPGATLLILAMLFATAFARAQFSMDFPDWKETGAPPPPAYNAGKLLTFDVRGNPNMTYGVDPSTIVISNADGLVRYVVVATSKSGVSNVMYEALHCATGEVKTYARRVDTSPWQEVKNAQWRSVFDLAPSNHSLALAKAGACDGKAPALSVREMVDKLKNSQPFLDQ
jgi:hypothetical protein